MRRVMPWIASLLAGSVRNSTCQRPVGASPLKGIDLRVLDAKGEVVLKGSTDGNGNALLNYTLDATHVLVASSGKDTSFLPFNQPALDLSEFQWAPRRE